MALPVINVETDPNKISQQLLDNSDKQIELFENIGKILTGSDKSQIAIQTQMQDASKKYYQREQNIQELVSKGALSNTSMKALKARNKAAFYWEKFGIKHKWLQKVGKGIATIAKGVANLAGNWFFKIIGFLLAMAIFDPSGKMLKSILKMIIGIVVWFVKILATMLPGLIKTMMNLITDVLPGILADLIKGVFPVLSEIFKKLAKDLENDFPIISWFIDALGNAFAKDGILYKFFMALSGMLPVLLGGFLILGAIMKMMPFLKMLFTVLKVGFFVLKILAIAAKALFGLLGPIGIIILLVVGGLILLWNYADKVVGFFESIGEWFMKLGKVGKILVGILALIMLPLTLVIAGIYGIAKLFQYIQKHGIKKAAKNLWKQIKKYGKMIWDVMTWPFRMVWKYLKKAGSYVWKMMKGIAKTVWKAVSKIFGGIVGAVFTPFKKIFGIIKTLVTALAPVLTPIMTVLKSIGSFLKNTLLSTINFIVGAFNTIRDYFSAIVAYGTDFFTTDSVGRDVMFNSARLARLEGTSLEEVEREIERPGSSTVAARKVVAAMRGSISRDTGGGMDVAGSDTVRQEAINRSGRRIDAIERNSTSGNASGTRH